MLETSATILNVFAASLLVVIGIKSATQLSRGFIPTQFVVLLHCMITATPMILDMIIGPPRYELYPGLQLATTDAKTSLLYSLYMMATPLVLLSVAKLRRRRAVAVRWDEMAASLGKELKWFRFCMYVLLILPVVYFLAFAPSYYMFLTYASVIQYNMSPEQYVFFGYLYSLTYLAIFAVPGLLLTFRTTRAVCMNLIAILPLLGFSVYINGKRNALFFAVVGILGALRIANKVRTTTLIVLAVIIGGAFGVYSNWYQTSYRDAVFVYDRNYDSLRLDWGRDGDIKLALFAESTPELAILEYRGQTLLFNSLFFVPREYWPDKPWPYYYYLTARALNIPYRLMRWGLTSSILGEMVANLGWWGILAGPLFLAMLCRLAEMCRARALMLATTAVVSLSLVLTMSNFLPVVLIWAALLVKARLSRLFSGGKRSQLAALSFCPRFLGRAVVAGGPPR